MNLGGVFALFGFDGDNKNDKKIKKELEAFQETPHFRIRMFIKMIVNGVSFKKQIIGFFSKSDKDLDLSDVGEAGDFMMYNRAFFWIGECNIKKKDWKDALQNNSTPEMLFCLKESIKYFESIEEFEKCASLITIQKFIEKEILKASFKET